MEDVQEPTWDLLPVDYEVSIDTLKEAWINEKTSPELLPYKKKLISALFKSVKSKEVLLESGKVSKDSFLIAIHQMELDRIKYMIRDYLRIRLLKLEKYSLFYLKNSEFRGHLSKSEFNFSQSYLDLLDSHFQSSFLRKISEQLGSIDKPDMIEEPLLNDYVIIRAKEDLGTIYLGEGVSKTRVNGGGISSEFDADEEDDYKEIRQDDVYIIRYNVIRSFIAADRAELL